MAKRNPTVKTKFLFEVLSIADKVAGNGEMMLEKGRKYKVYEMINIDTGKVVSIQLDSDAGYVNFQQCVDKNLVTEL